MLRIESETSERRSRSTCARPVGFTRLPGLRLALALMLAALLLSAIALAPLRAYGQPSSEPAVVELSVAEADSILATIEELEIDLWECERLAAADSAFFEERLDLQERAYEQMLDAYRQDRPSWLERVLKQPVIWLGLGMYIGVQAGQ